MKNLFISLSMLCMTFFSLSSLAQSCNSMVVNYKSGIEKNIPLEMVDSVTFTNHEDMDDEDFYYTIEFVGEPIKIMSTEDEKAASYDNRVLGYFNIVNVSENLYYLYYIAVGKDKEIKDDSYNLYMAWSTDGFHWIRGIPNGEGNMVMPGVIEQSVFKVPDNEYPFRLIGNEGRNNLKMWKSKDGITFTDKKDIVDGWHDTQNTGVVQGDRIKVYIRLWNPTFTNRQNGVVYVDFEGNQLTEVVKLAGDYLYNSAPLQIDEKYEILLPSFLNNREGPNDTSHIKAYLLDGYYSKEIDCDLTSKLGDDVGWCLVAPYLITIGGENYIGFITSSATHDTYLTTPSMVTSYNLIKVKINKKYIKR